MSLKFNCPACGKPIIVAYLKKGETVRCKNCNADAVIPDNAVETGEQPEYLASLPVVSGSGKREEIRPPVIESMLGPRTLGKFINDSFKIYSNNFSAIFFLYIVWQIVVTAFWLGTTLLLKLSPKGIDLEKGFKYYFALMIVILVTSIIVSTITTAATIRAVCAQFYGKVDIDRCFKDAFGKFWRMLGAGSLAALGFGAMAITIIGIPFALYYGICWAFIANVIVIENSKVINAFYRSKQLVKKSWWRVFGIVLVFYLPCAILQRVLYMIPYAGVFLAVFIFPACLIASVLLYLDLRVRKEGYTPDLLAKDLGMEQT
ncbi:MAG TPA: hypothetical protein VF399_06055 [bacterium]|jgi:hypothetical protein